MNRFDQLRKEKGLTYKELSRELGVSLRYVYFLRRGDRVPSLKLAKKIAEVLGAQIEDIF